MPSASKITHFSHPHTGNRLPMSLITCSCTRVIYMSRCPYHAEMIPTVLLPSILMNVKMTSLFFYVSTRHRKVLKVLIMRCYWLWCCKLLSYLIVRCISQCDFCCHPRYRRLPGWSLIDVSVGLLGFIMTARFQYTLLLSIGFNLLTISLTESLVHISSTWPGFEVLCGWSCHLFITLISILILYVYFFPSPL